jgi:hypothetical protein
LEGKESLESLIPLPDHDLSASRIGYDLLSLEGILSEWEPWKHLQEVGELAYRHLRLPENPGNH